MVKTDYNFNFHVFKTNFSKMKHYLFLLLFLTFFTSKSEAKRRGGNNRDRAFEAHRPGGIGAQQDVWDDDDDYNEVQSPATKAQIPTPVQSTNRQLESNSILDPPQQATQSMATNIIPTQLAPVPVETTTEKYIEPVNLRDDIATVPSNIADTNENLTTLWIDATYKAEDYGMNVSQLIECLPWLEYWENNSTDLTNKTVSKKGDEDLELPERHVFEVIDDGDRLEELGLDQYLLDEYESVGILFKEICGNHDRQIWYSTPDEAKRLGLDEKSPICDPFKQSIKFKTITIKESSQRLSIKISPNHEIKVFEISIRAAPVVYDVYASMSVL
ncbi:Glycine receptor subunit alphaZ1 [Aphelenchoides bicaudatus]|nr:Glycine receptor subunit alphaZ1 [Aphelenchoides bicaudatus]